MKTTRRVGTMTALILCGVAGTALAAPVVYNLGVMPGGTYSAQGVVSGDGNTVTGRGDTTVSSGSPVRPFRWVLPGPMQVVPLTTPGEGKGIGFNGQHVVGHTVGFPVLPFRWTLSSGFTSLHLLPGGTNGFAKGTSSNSAASVGYGNSTNGSRAIRWNSAGTPLDLGILAGATSTTVPGSFAFGISADGAIVVGTADWMPGVSHAFRWNAPVGPMISLGTLPGGYIARAVAVSTNNSTIAGYSDTTGSVGAPRAFRLKAPTPMQNLGVIAGSGGSPTIYTAALSGNGSRVVGRSYDSTFGNRAWIWMGSTGMLALRAHVASLGGNVTGWTFEEADGISTDGTSVSGSGTFNGQARAFLIKGLPCLDPTSSWFPDTAPPLGICADPAWPVGSGPALPGATASATIDSDGSDPLEHAWFVTIGPPAGTPPLPITGPIFTDAQTGLTFSVEGWTTPTITISNLRPGPQPPEVWLGGTVSNPCGNVATTLRAIQISGVCALGPTRCNPADIADDSGMPLTLPPGQTGGPNNGVTEGDYNLFFATFFDAGLACDIANDDGSALPPFGTLTTNNGVTEGDYNLFFGIFFEGCAL